MRRSLAVVLLLVLAACSSAPPAGPPATAAAPTASAPAAASSSDADIARFADDLMSRARAQEPVVSALLEKVADSVGGTMAGFEHRLKKRDSLLRKIRTTLAKLPDHRLDGVVIDD